MKIAAALIGIAILGYVLRDVFHTIFNPRGTGSMGDVIAFTTWKLFRLLGRWFPSLNPYSGPIAMLLIVGAWALSLVVAWALIFWSLMPERFLYPPELLQGRPPGWLEALNASALALVTLSGGNMTPVDHWLRLLVPAEGFTGFAIFSASVTWFLSVYPVLNRRRALANALVDLRRVEEDESRDILLAESNFSSSVMMDLAEQLMVVRGDILQFPITYFFRAVEPSRDLPAVLPYAMRLAKRCETHTAESTTIAGRVLHVSIEDFMKSVAPVMRADDRSSTTELLRFLQKDHLNYALDESSSNTTSRSSRS